jgi:hypothetical protein
MEVVIVIHIKKHIIDSLRNEILGSTKGYFIIYLLSSNIIGQLNRVRRDGRDMNPYRGSEKFT